MTQKNNLTDEVLSTVYSLVLLTLLVLKVLIKDTWTDIRPVSETFSHQYVRSIHFVYNFTSQVYIIIIFSSCAHFHDINGSFRLHIYPYDVQHL